MSIQVEPRKRTAMSDALSILASRTRREWRRNKYVYLMLSPVILFYLVFHYAPMYGVIIAFKDFSPGWGIWKSPWVGFEWFVEFFNSHYFWRLIRNTLLINVYDVIFGFPVPIIFALLLNELSSQKFKRWVQTVTYLPHFISVVVVVSMILDFLARDGLINDLLQLFGISSIPFMLNPAWFRTVYVGSGIWQGFGWGAIIYLAALSNIDPTLYEAAEIDGAGRWAKMRHVTIPGILPTVIIMLILRLGQIMSVGYEKIILMYNPMTYETSDVISTFVYRKGLLQMNYSYSTAIGLFNSIINFTLLILVNRLSRRTGTSLW